MMDSKSLSIFDHTDSDMTSELDGKCFSLSVYVNRFLTNDLQMTTAGTRRTQRMSHLLQLQTR